MNGQITIFTKEGTEVVRMQKKAPIWDLCWSPTGQDSPSLLAAVCWDKTISFYNTSGRHLGSRQMKRDACSLSFMGNGDYFFVGGTDRTVTMWSKEGIELSPIVAIGGWVWCCKTKPMQNVVAVGGNDGTLSLISNHFPTVHGLFQDHYALRSRMTDVVVQHLVTKEELRIPCRNLVKKIALYKDRLAVQLPDYVMVYRTFVDESLELKYKVMHKIPQKRECNLLVVTSRHIFLCLEKRLLLLNFEGAVVREWIMGAIIRYIKVIGGPPGREGLLVGLRSGDILKVFVDNAFPIDVYKMRESIRCLDMSSSKEKLAAVDEKNHLVVYDIKQGKVLHEFDGATSVSWNSEYEDMLCYSEGHDVVILTANFAPVHQKMQGFVVGFKGSKVFCLQHTTMNTVDIPQSHALYKFLERKDVERAYEIACLGVTDEDWMALGVASLHSMQLEVAKKAFLRVRDIRFIELTHRIDRERRLAAKTGQEKRNLDIFLRGEVYAQLGKYDDAAKMFVKSGRVDQAMEMFTMMHMWNQAQKYAALLENVDMKTVMLKQAAAAERSGDIKEAASIYAKVGETLKGIELFGTNNYLDELIGVVRSLGAHEKVPLERSLEYFREKRHHLYAVETAQKLDNPRIMMDIHVEFHKWQEGITMLDIHPDLADHFWLPYAQWLILQDRFDEAREAFVKANRPREAIKIVEQLVHNAVTEERFQDASFYYFVLSMEELKLFDQTGDPHAREMFEDSRERAEMYFAYHHVKSFVEAPFTPMEPENLFHMTRFLSMKISSRKLHQRIPKGMSRLLIAYAMAKLSQQLSCFKFARQMYQQLQQMRVPVSWQEDVDISTLAVRSKPHLDDESLRTTCYKCSSMSPMLPSEGDFCSICHHPFIRSFYGLDVLPLVEFILEKGISDEEAQRLIQSRPSGDRRRGGRKASQTRETDDGAQVLSLSGARSDVEYVDDDDIGEINVDDPFTQHLLSLDRGDAHRPLRVDRETLRSFIPEDVFIVSWPSSKIPPSYYRLIAREVPVVLCHSCNHFFHEDDYFFEALKRGGCPFCRAPISSSKHN
eukprot:TRINITY_DN3952_c0_g1_i1.p1 TRINITY_DN3952_c0_g1~~TRINITY_DN3952_c0_g1_i1.p1  ORF type:complete len:1238 (-),score=308.25 TRINITY_DN3952_c0_g1_i1:116-3280(-)